MYKQAPCSPTCGKRKHIFAGPNTNDLFCEWAFSKYHSDTIILAHNAKGYDAVLMYSYLINNAVTPEVIFNGSKIMHMHIKKGLNIRVVDSINFMAMSLKSLCKAFSIKDETKGYFPHYFNQVKNADYVDPLPPVRYYGHDSMHADERDEFLIWHKQQRQENKVFDMKVEIEKYCHSDVCILQLMLEATSTCVEAVNPVTNEKTYTRVGGLDPFQSITIAYVCMAIFQYMFLEEDWPVLLQEESEQAAQEDRDSLWIPAKRKNKGQFFVLCEWVPEERVQIIEKKFVKSPIAVVPSGGYASRDNYSHSSIQWLKYVESQTGRQIRHALNGGEFSVRNDKTGRNYRLDGYYEYTDGNGRKHNVCYEYNGCIFHGFPQCFPQRDAANTKDNV